MRVDVPDARLAQAFAAVRDWQALRDLSITQGLLPLLYARLTRAGRDVAPPDVVEDLRLISQANAERSIRHSVALLRILASLEAEGVTAVPFKGPLLADYAYGDVAMRYFQDLDLFVAHRQVEQACSLLGDLGFRAVYSGPLSARARAEEFHNILEGHGMILEVHWRTGPAYIPPLFCAEELMSRARPTSFLGQTVPTLDPSDLLLVLCVHGHAHRWPQLEPVSVLARVLEKEEYGDPRTVLERARTRRCLRRCLVAFRLAERLAGATLPPEFAAAIGADRRVEPLARKASALIRSSDSIEDTRLVTTAWRALALDTAQDTARLAVFQVFAPRGHGVAGRSSLVPESSTPLDRIRYLGRSIWDR